MSNAVRHVHHLEGLQAQPLASYLAALGVLRLVYEQRDKTVCGAWSDGHFVLDTKLGREQLLGFFLNEYQPTPLIAPWNGGSGFYGKKDQKLALIAGSTDARFKAYRDAIETGKLCLRILGLDSKPDPKKDKPRLIRLLRSKLDDAAIQWLDSCVALTNTVSGVDVSMAPLLGSGGNDGNFEFSLSHMQRLVDVLLEPRRETNRIRGLAQAALFDTLTDGLAQAPVGQFDPGRAGGPNSSTGLQGASSVNPWVFIWALEGAIVLSAATARRYQDDSKVGLAFPFTVSHLPAGNQRLAVDEKARSEVWLPLWRRLAGYPELRGLFAEGRSQVGTLHARNPIEFSLALASHGVSRGLAGFSRFAFLTRNGDSHFATPLGYYPVEHRGSASMLRQLEDTWFAHYRQRFTSKKKKPDSRQTAPPESIIQAFRRYDDVVMEHLSKGRRTLADVLERLGAFHMLLCRSHKRWQKEGVRPLPRLDPGWVKAANDESVEFRLALSLSTLGGDGRKVASLRSQLTPYNDQTRQWNGEGWIARWTGRDVPDRMLGLLRHRLLVAGKSGEAPPLWGLYPANRADVEDFIEGQVDDQKLERLLYALCLIAPARHDLERRKPPDFLTLPYLLPRLALHQGRPLLSGPDTARDGRGRDEREPPPHIVHLLANGKISDALRESRRFLLGRGLIVPRALVAHQALAPATARRIAAALLFPISDVAYEQIARNILRLDSESSKQESEKNYV